MRSLKRSFIKVFVLTIVFAFVLCLATSSPLIVMAMGGGGGGGGGSGGGAGSCCGSTGGNMVNSDYWSFGCSGSSTGYGSSGSGYGSIGSTFGIMVPGTNFTCPIGMSPGSLVPGGVLMSPTDMYTGPGSVFMDSGLVNIYTGAGSPSGLGSGLFDGYGNFMGSDIGSAIAMSSALMATAAGIITPGPGLVIGSTRGAGGFPVAGVMAGFSGVAGTGGFSGVGGTYGVPTIGVMADFGTGVGGVPVGMPTI